MYKQVIVIRTDLKLSKGKLAAQVAHGALEAFKKTSPRIRAAWERQGAKKVVLKVASLASLKRLYTKACSAHLPCSLIRDAGHTELRRGTITCLGIGPGKEERVDRVTGKLKML